MLKKWLFRLLILFALTIIAVMYFSPYGKNEHFTAKCVAESIVINAPIDTVFKYMGHSEYAEDWSVFVDHITPLNSSEIPDGKIGCVRRCFTQKDETGSTWDEEILAVKTNKMRRLSVYNLQNFTFTANHLLTEQVYEKIGADKCKLSLVLFFDEAKKSYFDELKLYFAGFKVADIFKRNLENIKKEIEGKHK